MNNVERFIKKSVCIFFKKAYIGIDDKLKF